MHGRCLGLGMLWAAILLPGCGRSKAGSAGFPAPPSVQHHFPFEVPAGALAWQPLPLAAPLESPVHVAAAPDGSGRLFAVEQPGRIRVFRDEPGAAAATFLDLSASVEWGGEMGLLGLAFPPDYAASGAFYVSYTAAGPLRSVLARYRVRSDDPERADPLRA